VLEAMALGRPVLCRRNEGNESLVAHGKDGLLFETPQEMVNLLQELGLVHEPRSSAENLLHLEEEEEEEEEEHEALVLVGISPV